MASDDDKQALALRIVKRLTEHGHRALYAGGCVRDRLMNAPATGDIDIATSAPAQVVAGLFRHTVGVGAAFGVVIVVEEGVPFEVATFRQDRGSVDGRHPAAVAPADERGDAQRRDFTINGMFYDPLADQVLDYVGGREDLAARLVRAIGVPSERFREDYLRMLRAVRFAARFGFAVHPETLTALRAEAASITRISAERIFQELDKMLTSHAPDKAMALLHETGLLTHVLPEVAALAGVPQPSQFHPEGDCLRHTLLALSRLSAPSPRLAWSTLLHDIGKPSTLRETDRIRFHNHDQVGAEMARRVLERLRAPRALVDDVEACVANHMRFMHVGRMKLSTLKRFLARPTIEDEMELHRVDCLASHGQLDNYELLKAKRAEFAAEQVKPAPLLRGADLIAAGLSPGPLFGRILREAYDLQLEEKLASRDQALAWLAEHHGPGRG